MTIRELSRKTGISKSYLNYVENGDREPTLSVIIRIAIALGIDEKELYEVIKQVIYKDIARKIEKMRKKLHKSIEKNGVDSRKTIKISQKLDEIINEYFKEK